MQFSGLQDSIDETLPDFPRLRHGISIFRDNDGLVIRSVRGAFRITPVFCEAMLRTAAKLDGTNDFVTLLGHEKATDAFYLLRMLSWFSQSGLVASGPAGTTKGPLSGDLRIPRPSAHSMVLSGAGPLSVALLRRLELAGGRVRPGDVDDAAASGSVLITCLDRPNLAVLDQIHRAALAARVPWLPIFPFGDAIVVGPYVRRGRSACFRCFELRWLGISPSTACERAYLSHLRSGGWRHESSVADEEAEAVTGLIGRLAQHILAQPDGNTSVAFVERESRMLCDGPLLPHPLCEVCAGSSADAKPALLEHADWFAPDIALPTLGQKIAEFAQGPCGLVSTIPPRKRREPSRKARLPEVAVGRFALPYPETIDGKQENWCHGSATRAEDARTLAIIEGLERYSGLRPARGGLLAPYSSLSEHAILPAELPLFSETQYRQPAFPFQPFDPDRVIEWTWGNDLTSCRRVLVPATAAWYGRDDELLGETSSGVAAHSSRGMALLNGALELVERDAFMIHWLHRFSPPQIELTNITDDSQQALLGHVQAFGYAVHIVDLTTDLKIPVFLATGSRVDRRAPALLVGAGASIDPSVAVGRALKELYSATLNPTPHWKLRPPLSADNILTLEDHASAYEHPDWLPRASFLWASRQRIELHEHGGPPYPYGNVELEALLVLLKEAGHHVIGVDITAPEMERSPLKVVRAIIPGLQPLGFGNRVRLGGKRLYEAPRRMGYDALETREDDLNRDPHCFP